VSGSGRSDERFDNPIERLRLLGEDDDAISSFLDGLDVTTPREREMLAELARTRPLADAAGFPDAHRHLVEALESLGRHGYQGSGAGRGWGPLRFAVRFLVRLTARYLVVSYLRQISTELRNLYWLREMETPTDAPERLVLRRARHDADGLVLVFRRSQLGLPTFALGGVLLPVGLSISRIATGALDSPTQAAILGVVGTLIVVLAAQGILHGTAVASRRIRLATRGPLLAVWQAVGWCGHPPRDQSRTFAIVAITLTTLAWLVIPVAIGLAVAT
jgi:hypothetical protein